MGALFCFQDRARRSQTHLKWRQVAVTAHEQVITESKPIHLGN